MDYKYLFGPVPSRRLGKSLGVDLVPFKVCSLNCVYCETGRTTNLTSERKEYIPIDEIILELKDFFSERQDIDIITFSGAGEPTLNSGIGKIISFIKLNFPQYKLALITNGTLLTDSNLCEEIKDVDLILPSLDAVSENVFKKINRGKSNLSQAKIIQGLINFNRNYNSRMWLEIFLIPGFNDSHEELMLLVDAAKKINPERVQLNTLDRPGTESWVQPMAKKRLEEIAKLFLPLTAEVIAKFDYSKENNLASEKVKEKIMAIISRRPCTIDDLQHMTLNSKSVILKEIGMLISENKIKITTKERGDFFELKGSR